MADEESKKRKIKDEESSSEDLGEEGVGAAVPAKGEEPEKEAGAEKKKGGVPAFKHDKDQSWAKISDGRNQKRVCVQNFKNMTLVHIREYYEKDGDWKPGKGIALTPEQFETVCALKGPAMEAVAKLQKK